MASVIFILAPLWLRHRRIQIEDKRKIKRNRMWVATYFFSLGVAFLFIEIAFIQKFILFLRHPLYAVGVVVAGFLLFAGLGSSYSSNMLEHQERERNRLILPIAAISVLSLLYLLFLPTLFQHLQWLPNLMRIIISLFLIAPLAFCMGIPFPMGLSKLSLQAPEIIPWAWGINGCASVISAVLATVLATFAGFKGVVITAVFLYVMAAKVYSNN